MKLIHMYFIDLRTCTYTRSGLGFDKIDLKNRKKLEYPRSQIFYNSISLQHDSEGMNKKYSRRKLCKYWRCL